MRRKPLKVLAVTGSRADWGFLSEPLSLMRNDPHFDLSLVVTGQHLDPRSGNTVTVVEHEGFVAAARVAMTPEADTPQGISRSMGKGLAGFADAIAKLVPDLILLLGDRYETLCAASAGLMARVPMAHLAGGDVSEGAIDDAIRHAVTKLAHLHFPTNRDAARRIAQMGENPAHIHCVGSTGLDRLLKVRLLERSEFFAAIGHTPRDHTLLVTMHPVTLDSDPLADASALLEALGLLDESFDIILTGSNADAGGRQLNARLAAFANSHGNATFHPSLGTDLYTNAMAHCGAVVGNSSSGLYEAPSLRVPAVNVGRRQAGRLRAPSVIDCAAEPAAIVAAINTALAHDCSGTVNPYGDGHASERIIAVLRQLDDAAKLLRKTFHSGVST